jgi:hypothetical protein
LPTQKPNEEMRTIAAIQTKTNRKRVVKLLPLDNAEEQVNSVPRQWTLFPAKPQDYQLHPQVDQPVKTTMMQR